MSLPVILQLRLFALYNLNMKVLALMGSVFITMVCASTAIMVIALRNIKGTPLLLVRHGTCCHADTLHSSRSLGRYHHRLFILCAAQFA